MDSKLNSGFNSKYLSHPWFKTKGFKITLTALGAIAVVLVVLFNQQIGNMLKFFGSRAALETGNVVLQGSDSNGTDYFLANGYSADVWNPISNSWESKPDAVKVLDDRLMLNP